MTYITNKKAYAMIVPHNYGRYYDKIVTDTAAYQKFWQTLATPFKSNDYVIFDTNNECKFKMTRLWIRPVAVPFLVMSLLFHPSIIIVQSVGFRLQSTGVVNARSLYGWQFRHPHKARLPLRITLPRSNDVRG